MRGKSVLTLLVPLVFSINLLMAAEWDVEYWQYLTWKNWERGPYKLYTAGEIRANHDISTLYFYRITEGFAYRACPYLDLEAHYTYIYDKPITATHFRNVQRYEFEVNPFYTLANGISLKWKNRFELIKVQNVSLLEKVLRHQFKVSFPIKNRGRLIEISCSDEVFYKFNTYTFYQNRFIPLELIFQLTPKSTFALFTMIRNFKSGPSWYRSVVLGTRIGF